LQKDRRRAGRRERFAPGDHLAHREPHADDAGRRAQHLRRLHAERFGHRLVHFAHVGFAVGAGQRVGVAAVDHDGVNVVGR